MHGNQSLPKVNSVVYLVCENAEGSGRLIARVGRSWGWTWMADAEVKTGREHVNSLPQILRL